MNNTGAERAEILDSEDVVSAASTSSKNIIQIAAALLFGVTVLLIMALAPMDVLHNAAHDLRHTMTFPCH